MKNIGMSRLLCILLLLVTVNSLFNYIFLRQDMESYSKGAVFSSIEVERSLDEFEILIEKETDDYTYYNDLATGFGPALSYHLVTSDRFVTKYEDFYWETYYPLEDSLRLAVGNFTRVTDKESYENAKKVFVEESDKFREAVNTLEELELN